MTSQDAHGLTRASSVSSEVLIVREATPPPYITPATAERSQGDPAGSALSLTIPDSRGHQRRPSVDSSVVGSPRSWRSYPSLSPDSARSGSPFSRSEIPGDGASFYSCYDRGYTTAEQRYNASLRDTEQYSPYETLDNAIRAALVPYAGDEDSQLRWLPLDKLFSLVNEESISRELSRAWTDGYDRDKIEEYAREVCKPILTEDRNGRQEISGRRSLFAILTLMNKATCIPELLKTGLVDKNLPLKKRPPAKSSDNRFASSVNAEQKLSIEMGWDDRECDLFLTYQKYMLSPFFAIAGADVPFYDLDSSCVLPFIEKGRPDRENQGRHGAVWHVKIHPAHHDMDKDGRNPYFAVKQIYSEKAIDVKEEVRAWARSVGVKGDPHLINLLAVWAQGRKWYLLFPWADGNLRQFWEKHAVPTRSLSLVRWIANECQGIAQALRLIHRNDSARLASGDYDDDDVGIHSDIKPENILWFDSQDGLGSLVICDFGFTRFHRRQSRSTADRVGGTDTYRGPEIDLTGKISRSYDIWALACLYLEFITWYLMGFEGVQKKFADERIKGDDKYPVVTDKFFNFHGLAGPQSRGAIIKPSVLEWVTQLRRHEYCSQYLHDFLDFIVNHLLVIDNKSRASCAVVGRKLRGLHEKCEREGESYCFTGKPRLITDEDSVNNTPFLFPGANLLQHAAMLPRAEMNVRLLTWMRDSGSSFEMQLPIQDNHARSDGETATARDIDRAVERGVKSNTDEEPVPNETILEATPLLGSRDETATGLSVRRSNEEAVDEGSGGRSFWSWCCCQ